ncbi:hypothetical protein LY01_01815 [Nonlabens xylanidelens]|uniref:Carboxypeptidase-like protein n=1 Tax=Nonlabens xylanidelens TaxID=191564 RepID=A0A2S6ILF3_9FLAO|nr:hypothetical protein [Nonlabens xylanidelens]PPK95062.1 hypothetical protein LY01_01815 [Nonlabens xylanidelens]
MKSYQIKFDNTCDEDWSQMTPDQKGRFCDLCSKSVIDFTGKTPEEVLVYLKANKNTCGRMSSNQLRQPVIIADKDYFQIPYSNTAASLMMAASLGAVTLGNGQTNPLKVTEPFEKVIDTYQDGKENKAVVNKNVAVNNASIETATTSRVEEIVQIKGTIKSKENKRNIENAKITFYGLTDYVTTYSDAQGNYVLKVPTHLIKDKNLVSYEFSDIKAIEREDNGLIYNPHFEFKNVIISKTDLGKNQDVLASYMVMMLGGVSHYRVSDPQPLVLVNGARVSFNKFKRNRYGKDTDINFESMHSVYIEENMAKELFGSKAKDGAYLYYDKLSK